MVSPFPSCPVNRECRVKENTDRKKKNKAFMTKIDQKYSLQYLIV